jgi:hypothetical protein
VKYSGSRSPELSLEKKKREIAGRSHSSFGSNLTPNTIAMHCGDDSSRSRSNVVKCLSHILCQKTFFPLSFHLLSKNLVVNIITFAGLGFPVRMEECKYRNTNERSVFCVNLSDGLGLYLKQGTPHAPRTFFLALGESCSKSIQPGAVIVPPDICPAHPPLAGKGRTPV